MRVSHEAIYQSLYVQGRGALRRELTACLRTGRALRVPRARRSRGKSFVTDQVLISERPAEADDRAVPGHWEGDLILGLGQLGDRHAGRAHNTASRCCCTSRRCPASGPRVKNGPALAGHGAEAVRDAIASAISTLPEQLRRSLTWDQGTEMAQHAQLRIETGLPVYFCDPQSPWQRGTNENTNGLLRQYFPKGTDLSRHSAEDLAAVAATLNSRPRKTLGWRTPAEALNEYLTTTSEPTAPRPVGRGDELTVAGPELSSSRRGPGPRTPVHVTRSGPRRIGAHAAIAAPARPSGRASATTAASPTSRASPSHPPESIIREKYSHTTGTVARTG